MAHATSIHHGQIVHGLARAVQFIARVPVSLFLLTIITILAIVNGSLVHHTDPALIQRWGISWDNLTQGHVLDLPISDLIVLQREHYISSVIVIALYTGMTEWLGGSIVAVLTFWPPSWIATMATVVLTKYLLTVTSWRPDPDLVHTADVGSSVGTWGSAGALLVFLYRIKPLLAWLAGTCFLVFLLARFAAHRSTADVAHIIGLTLGFLICRAYLARTERASKTA